DAGPLRQDFRRFLELLCELDPGVTLHEEPFRIVARLHGRPLCDCHPRSHAVHVRLGREAGGEVRCRTHEDFVDILARLLGELRGAATPPPSA
ncbi:MAG: hypothetical protein ACYDIE_08985, partial [Candidatus Krumholzibacteriia bacterium]